MSDLAPAPLRLTGEEFDRLGAAGHRSVRGKTELRRGVVVRMAPEHLPHARFKVLMFKRLETAIATAGIGLVADLDVTVRFQGRFRPLPDIVLWTGGLLEGPIPGEKARLCVEVSDSTLGDDQGEKRREYAEAGLAEYWVLDVRARMLLQFSDLRAGDYAHRSIIRAGETATSATIPGLSLLFDPPALP